MSHELVPRDAGRNVCVLGVCWVCGMVQVSLSAAAVARRNLQVCWCNGVTVRLFTHLTRRVVSWQRLVLHEEYHEATPEYKAQISRLDRVLTRLEAITAVGPSLTCTRTVHPDGTTELSLRRMFGDKDYFAAKSTDGPLLSVNPDLPTALHGMYHRPQLLNFSGKHGVIARLFVVLAFVGALVGGIMTFVDLVSDCLVVRELWLDDQRWWSVGSAIIILVSLLVSVFVLARERRYVHGSVVLTPGVCSSR